MKWWDKSVCATCGGDGAVFVQTTDPYEPDYWDTCLDCEDQWCRKRHDGDRMHHTVGMCHRAPRLAVA